MAHRSPKNEYIRHVLRDVFFVFFSIILAIFLARSGLIVKFVDAAAGYGALASLLSGMFFTSIFTIAPSTVALATVSQSFPPILVALWGGLGAMIADLIIFLFIRERIYVDVGGLMKKSLRRHFLSLFHYGFIKWVVLIAGAFIVASPIPDEIGLALIGLSRVKIIYILPVVFVLHSVGIFLFVLAARAVL